LTACFREIGRVLKPDGRVVFTYQHQSTHAWDALARAIGVAGLQPIQLFPLLGDQRGGLHAHSGSCRWDAVFVLARGGIVRPSRPGTESAGLTRRSPSRAETDVSCDHGSSNAQLAIPPDALDAAIRHHAVWRDRLQTAREIEFREPDALNFLRACLTAAALGMSSFGAAPSSCRAAPLCAQLCAQPPCDPATFDAPLPLLIALERLAGAGRPKHADRG
jgi:hypothetical protein